jgi:hypothetical protein
MVDNIETKSMWASKGVWGGIIAVVASAAGIWGYSITPADQGNIVELITSIIALGGGALAIIGRIFASKTIK